MSINIENINYQLHVSFFLHASNVVCAMCT